MRARGKIGNYKLPFTELLESFTDITWIEIGVFKGFNAKCVLDNYDISKMYLIDPYQSNSIFSEKVMRDSKAKAKASLAPYKDIVEWKETTSNKAQSEIANHSADVIFIDGDHSYAGVMEDLRLFVPKIREGGLVIGDDHNEEGVARAIQDYAVEQDMKYSICEYPSSSGNRVMSMFWFTK